MMIDTQMYRLCMTNYDPKTPMDSVRTYYGTVDSIGAYIARLEADADQAWLYDSTIQAFEEFCNGDLAAAHMVNGRWVRLLTPVKKYSQMIMAATDIAWCHTDGTTLKASYLAAHQMVVQEDDRFSRIVRPCFRDLFVDKHNGQGWSYISDVRDTYSPVYEDMTFDGVLNMLLFVPEQNGSCLEECSDSMYTLRDLVFTNAVIPLLN